MSSNDSKMLETSEQKVKLLSEGVPKELKNWMTNISSKLQDIPIWKLTIPGSHDSGSYGLDITLGISPDRPDLQNSTFVHLLSCLSLPAIYRWTKTQNLDITQQLNGGIRYIDIRTAAKPGEDYLYFCHGLYGSKVEEILDQINQFLLKNPLEIVFIDFQHFYGLSDADHKKLIKQIVDLFGNRLVPHSSQLMMDKLTLRYLWQKRLQVFVYYRNEAARMESPNLWPSRCLPNPWANTMSRENLLAFLDKNMTDRPPNSMYVTQGILTPSNQYVGFHCFSSLESDLADICNNCITSWIDSQIAGNKGPNIVMTDFIEWNNYEIPLKTIKTNDKI